MSISLDLVLLLLYFMFCRKLVEISKKMNLAPPCTDRAHFTRTVHMCTDRANLHGPCKSFLETDPIRAELAVCGEELLRHPKEREKGGIIET